MRAAPISGATVTAVPVGSNGGPYIATSDSQGFYNLMLPTGTYLVTGSYTLPNSNPPITLTVTVSPNPSLAESQVVNEDIQLAVDQPDLLIKNSTDALYTGGGIFQDIVNNLALQTVSQIVTTGTGGSYNTAVYNVELQNAGNNAQTMTLTAPGRSPVPGMSCTTMSAITCRTSPRR